jgi:DNA-binding NtrC family response regulator
MADESARGGGGAAKRLVRPLTELVARLRGGGADATDRERLAAVLELNRALVEALHDRRALVQRLLDEAVRTFRAERGFLVRTSADAAGGRSWEVVLGRNLDRESVLKPERKISRTVIEQCVAERRGVFVEDAQIDGELSAVRSVADMQLRSVLCMPLTTRGTSGEGECIGCIYLDHRFRSGVFRPEDLPWFQAFTDQAVIALHLVERVEREHERLQNERKRGDELAARVVRTEQQLDEVRAELDRSRLRDGGAAFAEFVGDSPVLLRCLHLIDRVAAGEGAFPVLVVGESGTGKELAARALHRSSPRRDRPFVAVNAAAVSPDLLESELFGHVRGAFTGADRDRTGLVKQADGGVLFLDEVTECDPEMQAKLLRLLENGEVRAVGSDRVDHVDVRVVAATNRDPRAAVEDGRLRQDLYYRLAVVTVRLPPLRERPEDLPALVAHFLAAAAAERGAAAPRRASPGVLRALARRTWPGNVRELRNEITRLDALASSDVIEERDLELLGGGGHDETAAGTGLPCLDLARLEELAIEAALSACHGNKTEAARRLGISRRALYNKLERGGERSDDA